MKLFCFLACMLLHLLPVHALYSLNAADTAWNRLLSMPTDTAKVKAMLVYLSQNASVPAETGVRSCYEVLRLAQSLKYEAGEMRAYSQMSTYYVSMSDFDSARYCHMQTKAIAEKINSLEGLSRVYKGMGITYYYESLYQKAIDYWLLSLKIDETLHDTNSIVGNLANIGAVYSDMDDPEKSIQYYRRALALNLKSGSLKNRAEILSNMGGYYLKKKDYKRARIMLMNGLKVARQSNSLENQGAILGSLASVYRMEKKPQLAYAMAYKSREFCSQVGDADGESYAIFQLGQICWDFANDKVTDMLNQYFQGSAKRSLQAALAYHDTALAFYTLAEMTDRLKTIYQSKAAVQESLGDSLGAYRTFKLYTSLKDTLMTEQQNRKLTETVLQYEFNKKEEEARVVQERKDQEQRMVRNSLLAGMIITLLFGLVFYRQRNRIGREKARSENLLLNILPAEVAEELKAKGEAEARQIEEVTVLFTDFKGFTAISEQLSPKELVRDLNACFSAFDQIMQKHGIEKIKTIGDAYMAAGGLPLANQTHAADVVTAALEIRDFMLSLKTQYQQQGKPFFEIRIGVHTGPVVAGIVGIKKFAYDIWGDTVNTASRMESSGEAGKVNISETTYCHVQHLFNCQYRGKVHAKGKGELNMYFAEPLETH